ncbi:MAG: hypothetical protein ACXWQJ_14090 [Bdellovibrionota bacterium]
MPDTSSPRDIDPVAAFLNTLISGLTTGVEVPLIEGAAESQVPFLALPIVKQLFEYIVEYAAGKLSIAEQQGVLVIVFNVEMDSKLHGVMRSALDLQNARKSGDQNAIDAAKQKAIDQWGNLIHFGGIAPVHN